jgi:hypothetical protein
LHDPDSDPVLGPIVKMARARRDGLIPGLPKVIGVGDSLKGATVYYDDGTISKNGVEVEQTRAPKELACYRAGGMTFDALVELWSTRKFDPCPHATTPDEAWQMDEDGEFGGGPGTWDEIVSFMCLGLLTPDEYDQISAASSAYRQGKPSSENTVRYFTLSGPDGPQTLVRLSWPKVQEYVTKSHPFWRKDPSLASFEWDSAGNTCSSSKAEKLMTEWGVEP